MTPIRHLYLHIPFCLRACPYCSFYKEVGSLRKTPRFLDALLAELDGQLARHAVRPRTIFLGGGTPSALSTPQLERLLSGLRERLDLGELTEWTMEMNPATVSPEKARTLRALGVNRISMGVQAWDDALLRVLGRVHTAAQAERSYHVLREAGFENVNLDLMFAIPTQTRAQWAATLEKTFALGPEHVSAYCLTYEEDTDFFRRFQAGEYRQDKEWDADLFEMTLDRLAAAGFESYEISNHARPGRECLHNLAYWEGADYLGLGPSAFSTRGTERWENVADAEAYTARVLAGESAAGFRETLDESTRLSERIAFGLRTNRGVPAALLGPWQAAVDEYLDAGFFTRAASPEGERIRLTRQGVLVADALAEAFV
ncbi:MAG: radical SAM family heme chaperone HemW [Chthoniobacteraceae bacterium]|nr:radical SAM family heme chaperone HemW [Chthoniobacteraceae bacterium]